MTYKLQAIKSAIQKANPEIMELRLGCIIHCKDQMKDFPETFRPYAGIKFNRDLGKNVMQVMDSTGRLFQIDENYEILGRPIHIADILATLKEKLTPEVVLRLSEKHPNDTKYHSWEFIINTIVRLWNLLDDNLDHNPQAWDLLYELICDK